MAHGAPWEETAWLGGYRNMVIFRVISLVIISAALMLLGADAMTSLETGTTTLRSAADVLNVVGQDGTGVQALLEGSLPAAVSPVVGGAMAAPAWIPLGVVGLILALIFRVRD